MNNANTTLLLHFLPICVPVFINYIYATFVCNKGHYTNPNIPLIITTV